MAKKKALTPEQDMANHFEVELLGYKAKFRKKASILIYRMVVPMLTENKAFEAFDTMMSAQLVAAESTPILSNQEEGFAERQLFNDVLAENFFAFASVDVDLTIEGAYGEVFKIVSGDAAYILRKPTRTQYAQIYNMQNVNPLLAWEIAASELLIPEAGTPVVKDSIEFVSCFKIVSFILNYKAFELKKK